jgi:hypothetical protein
MTYEDVMSIDPSNNPKPKLVEDWYDGGVIIAEAGPGTKVVMRISEPGVYYDGQMRAVTERNAARAGFNVPYYRAQKKAAEIKRAAEQRADQILATDGAEALKSPEQKREERTAALRKQVAKAVREMERETQRQADLQITRDLGPPPTA